MKKLLSTILVLALMFSVLTITASAEGTGSIVMNPSVKEASAGDTVTVMLNVASNPGVMFFSYTPEYDTARLDLVKMEGKDGTWTVAKKANWDGADDEAFTGDVVTLTFQVKDDAAVGTATVGGTIEAYNSNEEEIEFTVSSAEITIKEKAAGATLEVYGTSISLSGAIGMNVYVKPTEEQIADEGFTVKLNGQAFLLKDAYKNDDGLYRFSLSLRAKQMGTPVTITAVDGEGNAVQLVRASNDYIPEDSWTCSIVEYVEKTVEAGTPENLVNLVKAMSTYGNMAQTALGYTDSPAPKAYPMDDVTADMVSQYQATATAGEAAGVQYVGCSVVLDSETDLGIYLKADDGRNLTEFTYTVNGKKATLTETKQGTCVMVPNISAKNLDRVNTIVVKDNGKTVLTVKASAMSYVYGALNSSDLDAKYVNAAKALYLYSEAANTYWG